MNLAMMQVHVCTCMYVHVYTECHAQSLHSYSMHVGYVTVPDRLYNICLALLHSGTYVVVITHFQGLQAKYNMRPR